ncbi:hypothetical protein C5S39_02165 [Candidatus Methanophagaceae archaeon]|nr:hypothetical protein C5S39_02165 [Methanophagales archaeon]
MKNAIPAAVFSDTNAVIKSKIGNYVSKDFRKSERKDQYTFVYYKARFTEEPSDVIVKVFFQELERDMNVLGLWSNSQNSPKLREK